MISLLESRTRLDAMIGRTLSHYRIFERLGNGGMGVLYKAEDIRLGRTVALKFLPPNLTDDPTAKERLLREAMAASALDHPNICTILEVDEAEDGQAFIAMVCYEGQTLKERLADGPLPVEEALRIAHQIAQGLARAHEVQIVHRDIKPGNIMLTDRGEVKILDFGIARLAGSTNLTRTGTSVGTPAYMAPEQARGEAFDARADLWSLGVVLYEMLTGRRPFQGDYEAVVLYWILHGDPEPVRALRPEVPEAVEAVVARLLEKEPAERYQQAEAVAAALQAVLHARPAAEPVRQRTAPPSIAVLPFADISPERDQEYFCDGMAEEIINALTRLKNLHVVARTSAFSFKSKQLDIREIGRQLKVDYILEGSVRKAGDRVRISAQLINVSSSFHTWSGQFDRLLQDVFAIQDEIALAIAREVELQLTPQEQARLGEARAGAPAIPPAVYEQYLLGRHFLNRKTPESLQRAKAYFEQAIEQAPGYAPAYAGLATSFFMLRMVGILPQQAALPSAREAIAKALQFENAHPDAYVALGLFREFFEFDWTGAERAFTRAIELNPGGNEAYLEYGLLLGRTGRLEEGLELAQKALRLDPLSPFAHYGVAEIYFLGRQYDRAIAQCWQALELEPNFVHAQLVLGWAYTMKGLYNEARVLYEEMAASLGVSLYQLPHVGYLFAVSGRTEEAARALHEVEHLYGLGMGSATDPALILTGLGDHEHAIDWLERAYDDRSAWLVFVRSQPCFENLQAHPRMQRLLAQMSLD